MNIRSFWIKKPGRIFKYLFIDHLSRTASWIIIIVILWTDLNLKYWNKPSAVIAYDIKVYYAYLPATIIHGDLDFEFTKSDRDKYKTKIYLGRGPEGQTILQFTYGMSLLYTPFFLVAHLATTNLEIPFIDFEADGYTVPYKMALVFSCLFYLALGLYFLRKVLLKYFSELVTAISLISITLGTNIFYYSTIEAPMSHVYNFSLISIFIYVTIRWYEKTNIINSILLGFLIGLISLIRPNNIIVVLFFIFYGVTGWRNLYNKLLFLIRSYRLIILMIFIFMLVWLPQFLYWKHITGEYFYYSYSDQRFFFNNPQVFYSLFSYRKGLLIYMPILAFAFIGLPFLYKKSKKLFLPSLILLIINIYILSTWCYWWFGGSYGPRSYIDSYAIMTFPFAAFTSWIMQKNWTMKIIYILIIGTLIYHSFFQTKQYRYGAIHYIAMTKEAYWDSFLHLYPSDKYKSLLSFPNYQEAQKGIYYKNDLTYEEKFP